MMYKISSNQLQVPYGAVDPGHEKILTATLAMYDKGEDLSNSPLIKTQLNKLHKDCYQLVGAELQEGLLKRQDAFISLYESFKKDGYTGSPILVYFDDEGYIHMYDGYHRLSIMNYLGIEALMNCETQWTGIGGSVGRDFPLAEVLMQQPPEGRWLYQPIDDERVKGWELARGHTPARLDHIVQNLVGETVLDIGCSEGYFSRELAKKGYKVTAIDNNKGLLSSARYLSIIGNISVDYHLVDDWRSFVDQNGFYDNILLLSVIHNDMKIIGVEEGLKKLEALRGKASKIFLEGPYYEWGESTGKHGFTGKPLFDFSAEESVGRLEGAVGSKVVEKWSPKPGSRPIYTFDNDGVAPAKTDAKLILADANNYKMYLFKDDPIITPWIAKTRVWEPELTEFIKKNLKEGQTFVDVGANVGYYSLLASKLVGNSGKVYAFEPAQDSYEILLKNLELNKCQNVIPIRRAVSARTGPVKLFDYGPPGDTGRRGLTKVEEKDEAWVSKNPAYKGSDWALVDTTRLSDVLSEPPDFIKVDVEGGERDTLEGMQDILKQGKTVLILEDLSRKHTEWITRELNLPFSKVIRESNSDLKYYVYNLPKAPWWSLESWLAPAGRRTHCKPIFDTVTTKPCRNIMEIGVNRGLTALVAIKAAAQKVPEEEIHYYGFDLFEDMTVKFRRQEDGSSQLPLSMQEVKDWLEKYSKAKITLFKGNTRKILRQTVKTLPLMDLIHIDGGHSIDTMRNDWKYSSKLMHKDTVVYVDGCNDEMPFAGCRFLLDELPPKYSAEVMPEVDYYSFSFGRAKNQLLRIQLRRATAMKTVSKTSHFRFHLMSLPHSSTVRNWGPCAFTQLTYRFSQMMHDMGHEVFHYGTEGAEVACTEHIDVLTKEVQRQAYGDWSPWNQLWIHNGKDLAYTTFRKNAIEELRRRKEPGDILLISNGNWLREISDVAGNGIATVEPYVGYIGFYSKYKVFPSYAWMHHMYGKVAANKSMKENFVTGNWYDAVIQHFFDPADHTFEEEKDDYFLYTGRLIQRKGVHVAIDLCQRLGAKLIVCGQPIYPSPKDKYEWSLRSVGVLDENNQPKPNIEYIGAASFEELDRIRSKARAVIIPSMYMEPFGMVVPEALLSGTPVITTDWGAFPEIVPQGEVGYRCRTMDDFIWAANNVDKISPAACREYAIKNFSMQRIGPAYQEYFTKIHDLYVGGKGWYTEHPERSNLDWLKRY